MATMLGLQPWAERQFERKNAAQCDPLTMGMMVADCEPFPTKEKRRAERITLAANALIGVTAGVAMITTIVGIFAFSKRRERSANQRASTRVRLVPRGAGLTLSF
jgi:hypothetical protein